MAQRKQQAASKQQARRRKKSLKGLSRWGFPKRPVVMWELPWPMSAKTKRLFATRQRLGAELEDLEVALEARMGALVDDGTFVQREGKIRRWYQSWQQRLEPKFQEADRKFLASYAEDEKAAKSAAVVSIVHTRNVEMGRKPPRRKR